MSSGRLGSNKINPANAALIYSNTTTVPASVNVQATALSGTTNGNIALAIDSATISLNQTTVATTIASGSVSQSIYNLDAASNNRPLKMDFVNVTNESNSGNYPVSYWNGSAWTKPTTGLYGAPNLQKVDPYFLTNPSAYGKSSAYMPVAMQFNNNGSNLRFRYSNISTMTGTQFATMQQFGDSGAAYLSTQDQSYAGVGYCADPYTDWIIGVGNSGYMNISKQNGSITQQQGATSNSLMYNMFAGADPFSYTHNWYAPRIIGSNGMFIAQGTGYSSSFVCLVDPDLAVSLGSSGYAVQWNGTTTAGWWYVSGFNQSTAHVGWLEYNPTDNRHYFEQVDAAGYRNIYSFSRATLNAWPTRGNQSSNVSITNTALFTNHGSAPWASLGEYVARPQRIGASLWWTTSNGSVAYVSEDLKTWVLATTYFSSKNYPANTFNVSTINSTSYLYLQNATANISKFTSGYAGVSDTAVIEYNTSLSNYQRTGLLLSPGDKLYAQNYGSVPLSVTAMGYEGE